MINEEKKNLYQNGEKCKSPKLKKLLKDPTIIHLMKNDPEHLISLAALFVKISKKIEEFIFKNGLSESDLLNSPEDFIDIPFKYSYLGVKEEHYEYINQCLSKLACIPVEFNALTDQGELCTKLSSIFSSTIPKEGFITFNIKIEKPAAKIYMEISTIIFTYLQSLIYK